MKKFKFVCSVLSLLMLVCAATYSVYALTNLAVNIPSKSIGFTAGDDVFFNAQITYLTPPSATQTLSFGISNTTGEPISLDENTVIESDGDYALISFADGEPSIEFQDIMQKHQTTYQITNTGEKAFTLTISGIAYDNMQDQRYTTTINDIALTPTLQNAQVTLNNGTATYTVTVEPEETSTIIIYYQLARINQSFSVTENISLNFETVSE